MKKSVTNHPALTAAEKIPLLIARVKVAGEHAQTTKRIAALAKQKLKRARRTFKHARKTAKRVRKEAAKLRKALANLVKKASPQKVRAGTPKQSSKARKPV